MDGFKGINIKKIHIIVRKQENDKFDFINKCRHWDGFVLITSGNGYAIDKNGTKYDIEPGLVLLLRRNDNYEIHLEGGSSYVTSAFDFEFDGQKEFPVEVPFCVKCSQKQIEKVSISSEIWQSRSWEAYTKCRVMLLEFYLEILKNQLESVNVDKDISKAISFIRANFKNNFSCKDLAKYCVLSPSYLRTKFLVQTGMTITEYRNNLRISAAKEMLSSNYFTITEIALELGYCDIYHFSKTFKKIVGISPTNYIAGKRNSSVI